MILTTLRNMLKWISAFVAGGAVAAERLINVFSGDEAIINVITTDGELRWYKDEDLQGNNGTKGETG